MALALYKKIKTKKYYRYYICGIRIWKEPIRKPIPLITNSIRRQIERETAVSKLHEKTFTKYKGCYEGKNEKQIS